LDDDPDEIAEHLALLQALPNNFKPAQILFLFCFTWNRQAMFYFAYPSARS